MAPRRSGGSHGGSNSPVCPGFLVDDYLNSYIGIVYFVEYCLFLLFTLIVLIYACVVRKRSTRLAGWLIAALVFMSLAWFLTLLSTVLRECSVIYSFYRYYDFVIAYSIFFNIGQWLLLFIQVWGVNRMLSKRLESRQSIVKIVTLAVTGVMAALTAGYIGLFSYNRSDYAKYLYSLNRNPNTLRNLYSEVKLGAAYWILYLVSVLIGGALSLSLLMKMRSKSIPVNDVFKRVIALTIFMLLWVIFRAIPSIKLLQLYSYLDDRVDVTLDYLQCFFQILSYLAVISLCKLNFWKESATKTTYGNMEYGQPELAPTQPMQEQHTYHGISAPPGGNGHTAVVR